MHKVRYFPDSGRKSYTTVNIQQQFFSGRILSILKACFAVTSRERSGEEEKQ